MAHDGNRMMMHTVTLLSVLLSAAIVTTPLNQVRWRVTPSDLASRPLLHDGDLTLVGGFLPPNQEDAAYTGRALAYHDASLFFSIKFFQFSQVMELAIPETLTTDPATMAVAATVQAAADITDGHITDLVGGDTNYYKNWGLLVYNNTLIGSAYHWYDAAFVVEQSHFTHATDLPSSTFTAWQSVWTTDATKQGYVAGPMALIPSYAHAALGGSVLATGAGAASILARLSHGHAAFAFDPAALDGTGLVSAQPLMYFDVDHPMVPGHQDDNFAGTNNPPADPSDIWNRATQLGGVVIPTGTNTVLYFGRHGTDWCYGEGTDTLALENTLNAGGVQHYCYDPIGGLYEGEHAHPYQYYVWAFRLSDLAAVKAGTAQPWEVQPYDYWPLTFPVSAPPATYQPDLGGVAYDPATKAIYIAQIAAETATHRPIIWKYTHP